MPHRPQARTRHAPAADAEVAFTELSTAAVHMGFFDAPEDAGAINAETSRLCRRMEDFVDGFAVGDKLREVLREDSELYELFDTSSEEFPFRLVSHLALGGPPISTGLVGAVPRQRRRATKACCVCVPRATAAAHPRW